MVNEQVHVLVVDDNPDSAATLAQLLHSFGFVARTCTSGAEALASMHDFDPMVVMIDLLMPQMDGTELAGHLRAQFGTGLVIIAVTGVLSGATRDAAERAGVDFILDKPLDPHRLMRVLPRLK